MEKTGVCLECPLKDRSCINKPDQVKPAILIIGGHPIDADIKDGAFRGNNSKILHPVVSAARTELNLKNNVSSVAFGYAALCAPEWSDKDKQYLINADVYKRCSVHICEYIDAQKPKAIVCMGVDALHALGFKGTEGDHRGSILKFTTSDGTSIPVVGTFHIVKVAKGHGLLNTFKNDIKKAMRFLLEDNDEREMELSTPIHFDEVVDMIRRYRTYIKKVYERKKVPVYLAVDTETSSLKPYNKEDRVIAVSLSCKDYVGLAFPWEHNAHRYTGEQMKQLAEELAELFTMPEVRIAMTNGKFDIQWLRMHYEIPMNPLAYDTLLAEHLLDEDKKGEYSLKSIIKDRFPHMGRYEVELHQHLNECWKKKEEAIAEIIQKHREDEFDRIVEWWCLLTEEERAKIFNEWVDDQVAELLDTKAMIKIQTRKYQGKIVPKKAYLKTVVKVLKSVPRKNLVDLGLLADPVIPEELKVRSFEDADLHVLLKYAAIDAVSTRLVLSSQIQNFREDEALIHKAALSCAENKPIITKPLRHVLDNLALPMTEVLAEMEYNGVRLDRDRTRQYREIILEKMEECKAAMFDEIGVRFNLSSSSPDLANILFVQKGLPILKTTDSGAPSTDADTLKQLSESYDVPFLSKLLTYRKLDKCVHTYLDNWLKMSEVDGRIHCTFLQHGTATGRLSSSNPNLQNVPFQIKEANLNLKSLFLPDDGYDMYELDISNAEMRVLCAYSQDKALIDAFNTGKDLHCLTGAGISDYTYEDLLANKENKETDQYRKRQLGKKVNFGTVYCIGAEGLSNQLWAEMRIRESVEACQEYLNKFFVTYPGVKEYVEDTKVFASMHKFVYTYTGRRRRFPGGGGSARAARQAVNARIQATSSDLVSYNMIELRKWLIQNGGRLILTVHDSMPFQLPQGMAESGILADIKRIISGRTSEIAPWLPVEWKFDVGYGPNYGDTHGEVK